MEVERTRVFAIAEDEDHVARVVTISERIERLVESTPQRGWRVRFDSGWKSRDERRAIAGEALADDDLSAERADADDILLQEAGEEVRRGIPQQRQMACHAAGDIEHHDQPDGLRCVVELRDRLRPAFVTYLELIPREGRDEAAVAVRHGDEDPDGVASGPKGWLLVPGRTERHERAGDQRPACEEPRHSSVLRPQAWQPATSHNTIRPNAAPTARRPACWMSAGRFVLLCATWPREKGRWWVCVSCGRT